MYYKERDTDIHVLPYIDSEYKYKNGKDRILWIVISSGELKKDLL